MDIGEIGGFEVDPKESHNQFMINTKVPGKEAILAAGTAPMGTNRYLTAGSITSGYCIGLPVQCKCLVRNYCLLLV